MTWFFRCQTRTGPVRQIGVVAAIVAAVSSDPLPSKVMVPIVMTFLFFSGQTVTI
ncbi:MAG TPA: hypothetical protein PKZ65_11965 [Methanoregulaceae archaeon]|nr:hypothetical protein [Methanoregulaceae archaeon]